MHATITVHNKHTCWLYQLLCSKAILLLGSILVYVVVTFFINTDMLLRTCYYGHGLESLSKPFFALIF